MKKEGIWVGKSFYPKGSPFYRFYKSWGTLVKGTSNRYVEIDYEYVLRWVNKYFK